jgi:hypothetical protein
MTYGNPLQKSLLVDVVKLRIFCRLRPIYCSNWTSEMIDKIKSTIFHRLKHSQAKFYAMNAI